MKRSIYAALAIATLVLTGCATSHSPFTLSGQIYRAMTPDQEICAQIGKTPEEAVKNINMGKAEAVKYTQEGEVRIYTKGNLRLIMTIKDNKVITVDCSKITDNEYK